MLDTRDLQLPTATIGCSEYWQPQGKTGTFEASLLDHIVLPTSLDFSARGPRHVRRPRAPHPEAPPGYHTISDHCPVRVALHR